LQHEFTAIVPLTALARDDQVILLGFDRPLEKSVPPRLCWLAILIFIDSPIIDGHAGCHSRYWGDLALRRIDETPNRH